MRLTLDIEELDRDPDDIVSDLLDYLLKVENVVILNYEVEV